MSFPFGASRSVAPPPALPCFSGFGGSGGFGGSPAPVPSTRSGFGVSTGGSPFKFTSTASNAAAAEDTADVDAESTADASASNERKLSGSFSGKKDPPIVLSEDLLLEEIKNSDGGFGAVIAKYFGGIAATAFGVALGFLVEENESLKMELAHEKAESAKVLAALNKFNVAVGRKRPRASLEDLPSTTDEN